ncbi:MAG: hypothetical protein A2014_00670 [Spirochaetes bacterium GWF1_49_6]|jgi:hypothetical protein|nr:MAG: hypothetical protein A2014_00670 [Spirochaetes bacterium GWF1_49_6]
MVLVRIIALFAGGVLALSTFIAKKNPKAGELVEKLVPFQTYIGIGLFIWGVIDLIRFLIFSTGVFAYNFWAGLLFVIAIIDEIVLGVVLAMNFLKGRKELPAEKMEKLDKILTPFQIPLGFIAVGLSIYILLFSIINSAF